MRLGMRISSYICGNASVQARLAFVILLSLWGLSPIVYATTTTLTFDEFADGTVLTTQYQSLGVTISGASVFTSCPLCAFPPVSGTNLAYAPTGSMTVSFSGDVQTVSAYVTDPGGPAGIFAYDSSNNLLGQSVLPAAGGTNVLLTVTSPGNPIAYVLIHDGGGSFSIDNLSFTAPSSTPPPVSFFTPPAYGAGSVPYAVATGDFNGDGKLDLGVANQVSNNVSVLIGNGDGTFRPAVNYAAGRDPDGVAVGDFNGDGKLDLVVANGSSSNISVLLGNGDGTFQPAVNYDTGPGSSPLPVLVGDFNGDGKLDVVVGNAASNNISLLLGSGDGTFQAPVSYTVTSLTVIYVQAGDFNGDGKLDLAVLDSGNTVIVLLGNGDGTFQPPVNYAIGGGLGPNSMSVGDLNGDGKPDLVTANYNGNNVSVLLGNGDGTFQTAVNYAAGMNPSSVTIGDFNGDGKPDLVSVNHNGNNVSVLLGNGDGTFRSPVSYTVGAAPAFGASGDFNGDGKLDLAVTDENSSDVTVLLGNGDGTFQTAVNYPAGLTPYSVAISDFNNDGKPDLAVANIGSFNVSSLLGNGDGTFRPAVNFDVGSGLAPYFVTVGDFNGDGKPDLVVVDENSTTIGVLLGNGDGTFQTVTNYPVVGSPISIAVGDFNGDSKLDLAVVNETGASVSILLGNGDGTFQTQVPYQVGNAPNSVATGDFNGDGKLDLAVVDSNDNDVSILLGNGDGTFQTRLTSSVPAGSSPFSIAVGDFNGDGKPDLAVANFFGNNVSILLGNGNGTFQTPTNYAVGTTPYSVAVADMNGDGRLDLVTANNGSGNVSVLLGNGDGTFQTAVNYGSGRTPTSVALGDLNGDGKPDLAVSDASGGVTVLINTTPAAKPATSTSLASSLNPSVFGQSVTLTATVTATAGTPTGSVTFNDGTTPLGTVSLDANGHAAFSNSSLKAGQHSITAIYMPSGSFSSSTSLAFQQTVNQATPAITWATPTTITYGTALSATQLNATANVAGTFTYTPSVGTVLGVGGQALSVTFAPADSVDYTGANAGVTLTVNRATSTVGLTSSVNPSVSFQPTTLNVTITPQNAGAATGTVTFMDGATTTLTTIPVANNTASATISSLVAGTHSLSAVYNGDNNVAGNSSAVLSQVVNKATTTTAVTSSANPSYVNQSVTFTASLTGQFGGTPTGTVTFRSGFTTLATATLVNGSATFNTTYTASGNHNITAVYSGDTNFSTSTSGTLTEVVTKVPTTIVITSSGTPSFIGQPVTFTATLSSPAGVPTDGETVTFRDRGTAIGTGTTIAGIASLTTSSLSAGNHSATARYAGDATFAASTSTAISQVVNRYATTTGVASSSNPSTYGQPVTFTATVSSTGSLPLTGTVAFRSGGTTLATVALSGATASFTTSSLTAGPKSITAIYSGDSNNVASASPILTQAVAMAATATSLTSTPNPSTFGSPVTFTATITSSGGTPTGTVTFRRGTTLIGKSTLNASGVATVTSSTLPRGNFTVTATYNGSANFSSSSGSVVQTVN